MSSRENRDVFYMGMANYMTKRSTCVRRKVGAVLVKDNRVIACGYNGAPSGMPHCIDDGCIMVDGHCVSTVHAEASVISMCAKEGISTKGSIIYVTTLPCIHCAKLLINAGIREVYFEENYTDTLSLRFFREARVAVYQLINDIMGNTTKYLLRGSDNEM